MIKRDERGINVEETLNSFVEYFKPRAFFFTLLSIDVVLFYLIFYFVGSILTDPKWYTIATGLLLVAGMVGAWNRTREERTKYKNLLHNNSRGYRW